MTPVATKDKILRAATALFAKKGYDATNTKEIARRARVNEATIFRLFRSKQKLFIAACEWEMVDIPVMSGMAEEIANDDPEAVGAIILRYLTWALSEQETLRHFRQATTLPESIRERLFQAQYYPWYRIIGAQLEKLQAAGKLRKDVDPHAMVRGITMMIWGHQILAATHGERFTETAGFSEKDFAEYLKIWLRGVLAGTSDDPNPSK